MTEVFRTTCTVYGENVGTGCYLVVRALTAQTKHPDWLQLPVAAGFLYQQTCMSEFQAGISQPLLLWLSSHTNIRFAVVRTGSTNLYNLHTHVWLTRQTPRSSKRFQQPLLQSKQIPRTSYKPPTRFAVIFLKIVFFFFSVETRCSKITRLVLVGTQVAADRGPESKAKRRYGQMEKATRTPP